MKRHLRPSIAGSYFSYFFFLAMSVFFAYFYQQTFFYLLIILELFLPAFSYYLSKYCFEKLIPSIEITPKNSYKNTTATFLVHMDNPTKLPLASLRLTLSFHSFFYGEPVVETHVTSLRAASDNTLSFPVTLTKCGLYEAGLTSLEGFDFLHMFHFKKEFDLHAQIRIFPHSPAKAERHEAIYSEGFDEFEESDKKGNVSSNVTDIREYQPGDRLQKIHWKLSEKIDKLMVKENEATSTNEFLLLLELYQPPKEVCESSKELSIALDEAIEEAHSLSMELIQIHEIFIFGFYSTAREDFTMSTIRCEEDLENIFTQCFYESCYDVENLALDIYIKSGLQKGTILHVTHKGVDDVTA